MSEDPSAPRDAFGLTAEDWQSLRRDQNLDEYTGPALLWWTLAGLTANKGPGGISKGPLADLLTAITGDLNALARLMALSEDEAVQALAPALDNLYRRIAAAAEMASRRGA
jgi:hypothetical protein